jgi:hypothetical protein
MLNKKNNKKRFGTYTMVVMYCLGLFFSFTMVFLQEWQHIHYQNQINQTDHFQLLHFTAKNWHATENKREFKINGEYYDVQSISYKGNLVIAKVVKDELENEIRLLLTQAFQKQKAIPVNKKKGQFLSIHQLNITEWQIETSPNYFKIKTAIAHKNVFWDWFKTNKIFRPPC